MSKAGTGLYDIFVEWNDAGTGIGRDVNSNQ
jgi:hypothetical protein